MKHGESIQFWIARLNEKAEKLLNAIDIEELSSKEAIDSLCKVINQIQRLILLEQQIETTTPENSTHILMEALRRKMRGEIDQPGEEFISHHDREEEGEDG